MTKNKTFSDIVRAYELDTINGTDASASLTELGTAIAYSVINKAIDPMRKGTTNKASSSPIDPALTSLKKSMYVDGLKLDRFNNASLVAMSTNYNTNGDYTPIVNDIDALTAIELSTEYTISDGYDLVQTAVLAILEETAKAKERNKALELGFMEAVFTIKKLKRKTYTGMTSAKSSDWIEKETTPIQECFKAVRRYIESMRAVKRSGNGYIYINDIAKDESGISETIYRRFGKYADIGGIVTNINGTETAYTANIVTVENIYKFIEGLNLTARQAEIVKLRMRGLSLRQVADKLGISAPTVQRHMERMRADLAKLGYSASAFANK